MPWPPIRRTLIEFFTLNWGYDSNTLIPMPYDWRLSPDMLDKRDSFFSHVKSRIEHAVAHNKVPQPHSA